MDACCNSAAVISSRNRAAVTVSVEQRACYSSYTLLDVKPRSLEWARDGGRRRGDITFCCISATTSAGHSAWAEERAAWGDVLLSWHTAVAAVSVRSSPPVTNMPASSLTSYFAGHIQSTLVATGAEQLLYNATASIRF